MRALIFIAILLSLIIWPFCAKCDSSDPGLEADDALTEETSSDIDSADYNNGSCPVEDEFDLDECLDDYDDESSNSTAPPSSFVSVEILMLVDCDSMKVCKLTVGAWLASLSVVKGFIFGEPYASIGRALKYPHVPLMTRNFVLPPLVAPKDFMDLVVNATCFNLDISETARALCVTGEGSDSGGQWRATSFRDEVFWGSFVERNTSAEPWQFVTAHVEGGYRELKRSMDYSIAFFSPQEPEVNDTTGGSTTTVPSNETVSNVTNVDHNVTDSDAQAGNATSNTTVPDSAVSTNVTIPADGAQNSTADVANVTEVVDLPGNTTIPDNSTSTNSSDASQEPHSDDSSHNDTTADPEAGKPEAGIPETEDPDSEDSETEGPVVEEPDPDVSEAEDPETDSSDPEDPETDCSHPEDPDSDISDPDPETDNTEPQESETESPIIALINCTSHDDCNFHGACESGGCNCFPPFVGIHCETSGMYPESLISDIDLSCPIGVNGLVCSGRGQCVSSNCVCASVFTGPTCSQIVTNCPNDCSNHGTCFVTGCQCDAGYLGEDCHAPVTEEETEEVKSAQEICNEATCMSHGVCLDLGSGIYSGSKCMCHSGWMGDRCTEPIETCGSTVNDCVFGNCVGDTECICATGWSGSTCFEPACTSLVDSESIPVEISFDHIWSLRPHRNTEEKHQINPFTFVVQGVSFEAVGSAAVPMPVLGTVKAARLPNSREKIGQNGIALAIGSKFDDIGSVETRLSIGKKYQISFSLPVTKFEATVTSTPLCTRVNVVQRNSADIVAQDSFPLTPAVPLNRSSQWSFEEQNVGLMERVGTTNVVVWVPPDQDRIRNVELELICPYDRPGLLHIERVYYDIDCTILRHEQGGSSQEEPTDDGSTDSDNVCPSGCSGHGRCVRGGWCMCDLGWSGPACSVDDDSSTVSDDNIWFQPPPTYRTSGASVSADYELIMIVALSFAGLLLLH